MRLLVDVDGVLADFIGGVLELVHEVTGQQRQREEITRFDFARELGLEPRVKRCVHDQIATPGWWRTLDVQPGAVEAVAALRRQHEVVIVTSPWNSCPTWLHEREAWLREHFGIPHGDVIACSAKHCVVGDVFVDDRTETLECWRAHHDGLAVQWVTPHNRLDGWTGAATNDWDQLRRMIAAWERDR